MHSSKKNGQNFLSSGGLHYAVNTVQWTSGSPDSCPSFRGGKNLTPQSSSAPRASVSLWAVFRENTWPQELMSRWTSCPRYPVSPHSHSSCQSSGGKGDALCGSNAPLPLPSRESTEPRAVHSGVQRRAQRCPPWEGSAGSLAQSDPVGLPRNYSQGAAPWAPLLPWRSLGLAFQSSSPLPAVPYQGFIRPFSLLYFGFVKSWVGD